MEKILQNTVEDLFFENYDNYQKIFSGCLKKLDSLCEKELIKDSIKLALSKTLNNIKDGTLSPAEFPLIIEKDLDLKNPELALELSIICAYFHTSVDLAENIENNSKDNPVINKYGKAQAINISNKMLFISQKLILRLNINEKNKIELLYLFSKCGNEMSTGQFYDIELTNRIYFPNGDKISEEDLKSISKNKKGKEIACFLTCILTALGIQSTLFYNLGISLGLLMQVYGEYHNIWETIKSNDLVSMKNTLAVYSACNDRNYTEKIRLSLAGKNDLVSKKKLLRNILAKTETVNYFNNFVTEQLNEINTILDTIDSPLRYFAGIVENLIINCESLLKIINDIALSEDNIEITADFGFTIDIALDYINFDNTFKDTWEIQRWGFIDEPILVGNVFSPALILEALLGLELDIDSNLEDLLKLRRKNGWSYYSNSKRIPVDSDDLGQLLNLTGKTGNTEKYYSFFKEPLEILEKNIEKNGKCPTWLSDENHSKEEIEKTQLYGNECIGVMANLYYGLFSFDKKEYLSIINKGIEYIIEKFENFQNAPVAYYKHDYVFYLVSRLVNSMNLEFPSLNKVREQMIKKQLLNGSWDNSPQNTAFVLLALLSFKKIDKIVLKTALIYLCDSQNYDGSWDGEDLYICPGKGGRLTYYKNPKVTSSFCLRALADGYLYYKD